MRCGGWTELSKLNYFDRIEEPTVLDPVWIFHTPNGERYFLMSGQLAQILEFHKPKKKWWQIWR